MIIGIPVVNTITISDKGYPVLKCVKRKGLWVTQPCLYCGRRHHHGAIEGHRIAHCINRGKLLEIVLPDGRVISRDKGYYLVKA